MRLLVIQKKGLNMIKYLVSIPNTLNELTMIRILIIIRHTITHSMNMMKARLMMMSFEMINLRTKEGKARLKNFHK